MFDIDQKTVESVARSPYTAGFLGGLILVLRGGPDMTWWVRVSTVVIALLVAGIFGPAGSHFFKLESDAMQFGFAGFLGIFGLNLAQAVFDAVINWLKTANLSDYIPWGKK